MARLGDAVVDDDRLFWEIARRYASRPMICGVYLALAGAPDRRWLQARLEAAVEAHPRLGWRLLNGSGGPQWQRVDSGRDDGSNERASLVTWEHDASLRDHDDFLRRAASRMNEPLPAGGRPWSCRIIGDRAEGEPGGRVHGIWIRWQHALCDGEGMLDLVAALCAAPDDDARSGELRAMSPALAGDRKPMIADDGGWARRGGLRELLRQRRAMARGRRTATEPGSDTVEIRRLELPLRHEPLLALARRHGATTHDVALSLSAWAIERHQQLGHRPLASGVAAVRRGGAGPRRGRPGGVRPHGGLRLAHQPPLRLLTRRAAAPARPPHVEAGAPALEPARDDALSPPPHAAAPATAGAGARRLRADLGLSSPCAPSRSSAAPLPRRLAAPHHDLSAA